MGYISVRERKQKSFSCTLSLLIVVWSSLNIFLFNFNVKKLAMPNTSSLPNVKTSESRERLAYVNVPSDLVEISNMMRYREGGRRAFHIYLFWINGAH